MQILLPKQRRGPAPNLSAMVGASSLPSRWSAFHVVTTLSAVARSMVLVMVVTPPDLPTRRRPSRFAALVLFANFLTYVVLLLTPSILEIQFSLSRWDLRVPRLKIGSAFTFLRVRPPKRTAKMLLSPTSWKTCSNLREMARMNPRALPEQINLIIPYVKPHFCIR